GVGLLAVIHREREEVEALAAGRGHHGDEGHGVADADDHGAAGLLGEMAGLDAQEPAADGSLYMRALNRNRGHGLYLWNGAWLAPARKGRLVGSVGGRASG